MNIKIDDNIPIPANRSNPPRGGLGTVLATLQPGQSILLPSLSTATVWKVQREKKFKFTTHKTPEGMRCWRVS